MLRDPTRGALIGRAVLRHLEVEGRDEVEVGMPSLVAVTRPMHSASRRVMAKAGLAYERDIMHEGLPHVLFRTRSQPERE